MRTWTLNDSIEKSRILNFQMNSVVREGFKTQVSSKMVFLAISLKEFSLTERAIPLLVGNTEPEGGRGDSGY